MLRNEFNLEDYLNNVIPVQQCCMDKLLSSLRGCFLAEAIHFHSLYRLYLDCFGQKTASQRRPVRSSQ